MLNFHKLNIDLLAWLDKIFKILLFGVHAVHVKSTLNIVLSIDINLRMFDMYPALHMAYSFDTKPEEVWSIPCWEAYE